MAGGRGQGTGGRGEVTVSRGQGGSGDREDRGQAWGQVAEGRRQGRLLEGGCWKKLPTTLGQAPIF